MNCPAYAAGLEQRGVQRSNCFYSKSTFVITEPGNICDFDLDLRIYSVPSSNAPTIDIGPNGCKSSVHQIKNAGSSTTVLFYSVPTPYVQT